MSAELVSEVSVFECCVCWEERKESWATLAKEGWRSHHAGYGIVPIILCSPCSKHMADRRAAVSG